MAHRNAPLTETGRLRLARCVVEDGWPLRRAAERFQVSHTTAARWAARYRQDGAAGMADRSSRPHPSPARTPADRAADHGPAGVPAAGPGPDRVRLGLHPSTVHAVLARYRCPPPGAPGPRHRAPVRRYERDRPGELVHVDVKKLGNIPDGGGHRVLGTTGPWPAQPPGPPPPDPATRRWDTDTCTPPWTTTPAWPTPRSSLMRRKDTAAAFLARAHAWYAAAGITIERVLSDNGSCYRSLPGPRPASSSASRPSGPAPTGPRPTARSSATTAPSPTNGPTHAPTPPKPNAGRP